MLEEQLTEEIISAAIEVHRTLGPGLLESAYVKCLCFELISRGLKVECEVPLRVRYKGVDIDCGYRLDIVVNDAVIIEAKSVAEVAPIHEAQLLTYLKLSGKRVALLINFNVELLKNGITRRVL